MAKKEEKKPVATIDILCKQLQKKIGDGGSIMCLDENFEMPVIDVIDTGICTLNEALGVWGWPVGRIIELFGKESSCKTTLALKAIAEAQKKFPDKKAAFIDCEYAFDPIWAAKNGVNVNELIFSQPDTMESSLDIVEGLCESGLVSLIVLDSVSAMAPQKELEADMSANHMGLHARLMSQAMRKIKGKAGRTNTTVIFINQIRSGIGPYAGEETSGGKSLRFYATVRVRTRPVAQIGLSGNFVGLEVEAQIKKNKVAAPYKTAIIPLYFDSGISNEACLIRSAIDHKIIKKGGSWLTYREGEENEIKVQGAEKFRFLLMEDKELLEEIQQKYKDKITSKKVIEVLEDEEEGEEENV